MHRKLSPESECSFLLAALIAGAGILVACERKPAHAAGRPAGPSTAFPVGAHRQIASLLSFEANALRVALVRP